MPPAKRKWSFYVIACAIAILPILVTIWYASLKFDIIFERYLLRYGLSQMSESGKREIYALLAEQSPGMWEAVPEPLVGSILQRSTMKRHRGSIVRANNAGMRSAHPYSQKMADTYRIVCLGDSLVFGMAGREQDRFGDQIGEILGRLGVSVDGKKIEIYSVGLPGWNTVNEVAYLSSRISEYDPDLVLPLMCTNDLNDAYGIMGIGELTQSFSPQYRRYGSGVISDDWPMKLLLHRKEVPNVLLFDLGPESRTRWQDAFGAWRRLETLLDDRGARMLLGILYTVPFRSPQTPFMELCEYFHERSGMKSPFIYTDYFDNSLPHDYHPNREGHRIMAVHYMHTLADLGWLPIRSDDLPALDSRLDTVTRHPVDEEAIEQKKRHYVEKLPEKLEFDDLSEENALAILGGVYRGKFDEPLKRYPDGSPKSVFVLRRDENASTLVVEIEASPLAELYPFKLKMSLNGQAPSEISLDDKGQAGRHRLRGVIPRTGEFPSTIEVALRTDSYRTTIYDPTMRSYKLISAWQE